MLSFPPLDQKPLLLSPRMVLFCSFASYNITLGKGDPFVATDFFPPTLFWIHSNKILDSTTPPYLKIIWNIHFVKYKDFFHSLQMTDLLVYFSTLFIPFPASYTWLLRCYTHFLFYLCSHFFLSSLCWLFLAFLTSKCWNTQSSVLLPCYIIMKIPAIYLIDSDIGVAFKTWLILVH